MCLNANSSRPRSSSPHRQAEHSTIQVQLQEEIIGLNARAGTLERNATAAEARASEAGVAARAVAAARDTAVSDAALLTTELTKVRVQRLPSARRERQHKSPPPFFLQK